MRYRLISPLITLLFACSAMAAAETPAAADGPAAPERVDNFRLNDQNGKSWEFYRFKDAPAVVIYVYGLGCPIVQKGMPGLERLKAAYSEKGVQFVLLNPSAVDTPGEVAEDAKAFSITAPILMDTTQTISRSLGVTRTAEAIVVNPKDDWKIVYRGAVDDRFDYGAQKETASKEWLADALDSVLAGKPVAEAKTLVKGCAVTYVEQKKLSYETDIAPILESKCVSCHSDGGIGPFALSSYKKFHTRQDMIREVVRTKLMPPWHADRSIGKFENDRSLTPDEERALLTWIEQGGERDESAPDPLAEAAAKETHGEFALGKPDLLLQLPRAQEIPAEGVVDYRYITVPTGLTEDKWVKAIEVVPTNRAVVHHALIFVTYPKEYRHMQPRAESGLNGYFGAYLPGAIIKPYPNGSGQFLPKGSSLIFQMHYNPTGKPESDQTKLALYFHDKTPETAYVIQAAAETDFKIPPNEAAVPVEAGQRFERGAEIYGLSPHMHYRGGSARFIAVTPDDGATTMLNVPFYQFDWQPMYFFQQPINLPPGSRMEVEGTFDNSVYNPRNPNPNAWVFFGEQSFEEMFIGYVAYGRPMKEERYQPREVDPSDYIGYGTQLNADTLVGTKWHVTREIAIEFQPDGVAMANGTIKGKWKVVDNDVYVESGFRNLWLSIMGDELLMRGRPMKRVQ